jgi:hypothetical protein
MSTPTSNDGYAGQQSPSDSASGFNVQNFIVWQILSRVRTVTPVKVVTVQNDGGVSPTGFVDVQPLVDMIDGLGQATQHGIINNLMYFRLQGGKNAVIIDPEVGDIGVALIADRDVSAIKASKKQGPPGSRRMFDLADGIFVGGILNAAPEQYVQFNGDGMKLACKNDNTIVMNSDGITINGVLIDRSGNISGVGTLDASGEGTFDGHTVGGHTHDVPGVQTGGSTVPSDTPTG